MLRRELPTLKVGEMVLAKWPGDGFYYECRVHKRINQHLYQLENMLVDSKCVLREDIFSLDEQQNDDYTFKVYIFYNY